MLSHRQRKLMPSHRQRKHAVLQTAVDCHNSLMQIWGTPCGLHVTEAYFRNDGTITAQQLGPAGGVSDDTARRELDQLLDKGKVDLTVRGRARHYRAKPALAEKTVDEISQQWLRLAKSLLTL